MFLATIEHLRKLLTSILGKLIYLVLKFRISFKVNFPECTKYRSLKIQDYIQIIVIEILDGRRDYTAGHD